MKKVLAIVGPTAVGKTDFGIRCAKCFNGEIISGDSIQIYKGLDIGSAKADSKELKQVKHYLIDIKEASDNYSVKEFQQRGRDLIDKISSEGKLPIVVGGTGLYVKALLYDYVFFEEKEEDDQFLELSNQQIYEILEKEDPKSLEKIHINNRKRLVRALNIIRKHEIGISSIKEEQQHIMLYDAKIVGLTVERSILYKKIEERIEKMFDDGLIKEIEELLNRGITFENQSMQGIGYKELKPYFCKKKSMEECKRDIIRNTKHFAKRQYTWFNNQMPIDWYFDKEEAIKDIEKWINI